MDESKTNIRVYLEALLRKWYWILGAAVLGALLAFGFTRFRTPTYESTAIVLLSQSSIDLTLADRISTGWYQKPSLGFPLIAMSDSLLEDVVKQLASDDIDSVPTLRSKLNAELHRDNTLLLLSASDENAAESAKIVNTWAEMFVRWVNADYSDQGDKNLQFYETTLEESRQVLEKAEQDRIDFSARDLGASLTNEYNQVINLQDRYLAQKEDIGFLMEDIKSLKDQLASGSSTGDVTLADQLTAMVLQFKAFNAGVGPSFDLQFNSTDELTAQSKQEVIQLLQGLYDNLSSRLIEIDQNLQPLSQQLLDLQKAQKELEVDSSRIQRAEAVADEKYMAILRKVEEERFEAQDTTGDLLLASRASIPERPRRANTLLFTMVGGAFGFFLASAIVLALFWWNGEPVRKIAAPPIEAEPEMI